ncbi:MAG: VIT1/CCC1 transporter family protein [Candidatus Bathyarchaeia archaeon]
MRTFRGFQGFVFGVVDGFIMLAGVITVFYRVTTDPRLIVMAGIGAAISDSLANAFGFYASELSERGQQIHLKEEHGEHGTIHSKEEVWISAVLSFLATPLALVIPLFPFFLLNVFEAMLASLSMAIGSLFLLGYYVGKLSKEKPVIMGIKYAFVGISGAIVSSIVGDLAKLLIGL